MYKIKIITLRLTEDQLNLLDKMCKKNFLSRGEFIRLKLFKVDENDK